MIRLPIEFEQQLLEYARELDRGESRFESELDKAIAEVLQTSRLGRSDRIFAGKLFDRLRQRLKNPLQN